MGRAVKSPQSTGQTGDTCEQPLLNTINHCRIIQEGITAGPLKNIPMAARWSDIHAADYGFKGQLVIDHSLDFGGELSASHLVDVPQQI
jgi:hypothetical protein